MPAPDTNTEQLKTILMADVCDSTPLYENTDTWAAAEIIGTTLDGHAALVERSNGVVVRSKGDDLLCTFIDADAAVEAALAILNAQQFSNVQLRIGVHYGTFIGARGDIFGDAVNVAARLMSLARPDEGIASAALAEQLSPRWRKELVPFDRKQLKGKSDATVLFRILSPDDDATEMHPTRSARAPAVARTIVQLELTCGEQQLRIEEGGPAMTIGRGDESGLSIDDRRVSRAHATISLRNGRATLTDRSTLGTWVVAHGNELLLRRETVDLVGTGMLYLGAHLSEDAPTAVSYRITTARA